MSALPVSTPSARRDVVPRPETPKGFLPEIQALRALAVILVVAYHLWPGRVPGGFIGVDVFFVISGFLITGHLARPLLQGRPVGVLRFWSNRIWRLLPASLFVLLACFLVVVFWAPLTIASDALRQVGASAAYVVNWVLAGDAVDYLAADNVPTLVQHYWSLSVEEQFYLVWPLLLGATAAVAAAIARRLGRFFDPRRVLFVVIAIVVAVSLVYSIITTASHPQRAYFDTMSRVWEFGAGGLLALLLAGDTAWLDRWRSSSAVARFAAPTWVGLALILGSALLMSGSTPFPSYWAALPVAGTLLVILGGNPPRGLGLPTVYRSRPVQFLGDVSYSLYLWHWPLIVWFALVMGRRHGVLEGLALAGAAVLLAWITKLLIEDPLRRVGRRTRRTWPAFVLAAAGALALLIGSTAIVQVRDAAAAAATAERTAEIVDETGCVGANATLGTSECAAPFDLSPGADPVLPFVDLNPDWCLTWFDQDWLSCEFGDPTAQHGTIALVGDSHAASLANPMGEYFSENGWRVVTYTRYGCPALSPTPFGLAGQTPVAEEACAGWTRRVTDELVDRDDIDIVVYTSFEKGYSYPEADGAVQLSADSVEQTLSEVAASGKDVVLLRDFPATALVDVPTCVAGAESPRDECSVDLATAFPVTPQTTAAATLGDRIRTIDMRQATCDDSRCYGLVGDVIVYADNNHMSQTFARSLMPYLGPRIVDPHAED